MGRRDLHVLIAFAMVAACDPVNTIEVRFHTPPSRVTTYWVRDNDVQPAIAMRQSGGDEYRAERGECCGTAHAFRTGKLHFVACVEDTYTDARTLVCGTPGAPEATFVRAPTTYPCDLLGQEEIDLATCVLQPRRTH